MSLKTKLRLSILALVLAVVLAYSWVYLSLLTRLEFESSFDLGQYVTSKILPKADQVLRDFLASDTAAFASGNPLALGMLARQALASDPGLNTVLESSVGYSYTIYDVAIVDEDGMIVAHSDTSLLGMRAPQRYSFEPLLSAGALQQLRVAYGPVQVYEVTLPLMHNQQPFGSVRVGVSTERVSVMLALELRRAVSVVMAAVILAMVLAWVATGFLLKPLASITVSLDRMTRGQFDSLPRPEGSDEFGAVASKLQLLGQQFRDAKDNLAQVLHGLEEALLLFTRDGRAILASDRVQEFLGLEPSQILGRQAEEIFAAESPLSAAILPALRDGRPVERLEVEIGGPSRRRIAISVQFLSSLDSGPQQAALVSLRDVESVRKLESQIELSHRLAAIGRLTSGVAHEVKNPLNAMVLHLEALKAKLAKAPASEALNVGEHVEIIANEIYRLDRVVKTFLDFTRPVELHLQEIEMNRLVEEVIKLAEAEASPRQVQIVFENGGGNPRVRVDRDLIKQAVLNVVLNGCQAMSTGGRLTIRDQVRDGGVELTVSDQGPGIPAEIREKIFDLYFTTRTKGSGIGLPLAFRAFQLHNGLIDFTSAEGKGTTFRLRLPLAA